MRQSVIAFNSLRFVSMSRITALVLRLHMGCCNSSTWAEHSQDLGLGRSYSAGDETES